MKKKTYLWPIIGFLLVLGGYFWYSQSGEDTKKTEYVSAKVEKGTLTDSISASGNIIVDTQSTVDPTITGTVADLSVKVGDQVTKGQFLFNIINDDLGVSVAKAVASYESAKNSLESAQVDKKDAEAKYDKAEDADDEDSDAYSGQELNVLKDKVDLANSKIFQAQKSLAASWAEYKNAQTDAGKRKVVSAISGTIQEVNVKNGDDLSRTSSGDNASAPIIIGDLGTLKASVEVNEVDIAKVTIGQKVSLKLDAFSETEFSGQVEKIDALGTVEQGVVSYNVTIAFDTINPKIKPDMSVSAAIITDVKQNVLMVPTSAVKNEENNYYVEVLNNNNLERKSVQIGTASSTHTEIISGISQGENIVTQTIDVSNATSTSTSSSSRSSNSSVRVPGMGGFR